VTREIERRLEVEGKPLSESLTNPLTWAVFIATTVAISTVGIAGLAVAFLAIPVNIDVEYESTIESLNTDTDQ
jgi:hypothetical protein